jgi:hypothetical protein
MFLNRELAEDKEEVSRKGAKAQRRDKNLFFAPLRLCGSRFTAIIPLWLTYQAQVTA